MCLGRHTECMRTLALVVCLVLHLSVVMAEDCGVIGVSAAMYNRTGVYNCDYFKASEIIMIFWWIIFFITCVVYCVGLRKDTDGGFCLKWSFRLMLGVICPFVWELSILVFILLYGLKLSAYGCDENPDRYVEPTGWYDSDER